MRGFHLKMTPSLVECSPLSPSAGAPAGAAHRLTARPWLGLALSTAFAIGSVWLGLILAYLIPSLPPSTAIIGVAVAIFGIAALGKNAPLTAALPG